MLDIDEILEQYLESNDDSNTTQSFVAGVAGGLAGLVVGHPFDTIKVRLQAQISGTQYKGTWNCFLSILRNEKVFGFYKGMASPAAGVSAVNALVFGSYNWLMEIQTRPTQHTNQPASLTHIMLSGMGAGLITSLVTCPMELAKVQLQNQKPSSSTGGHYYKGPIDCLVKLYRGGGIRRCFTGLMPTAARELSFGPYFVAYECICRTSTTADQYLGTETTTGTSGPMVILAGGVAGIVSWCSTYPVDVIKTRIQSEPGKYRNMRDCFIHCYRTEGLRVFVRGLTPALLRAFPTNAATFVAYTWTMQALSRPTQQLSSPPHNGTSTVSC